jgi:hypothetical protein
LNLKILFQNAVAQNRANGTNSTRTTNNNENGGSVSARVQSNGSGVTGHQVQVQYCGPYKLDKTLGKGQTGKFNQTLKSFDRNASRGVCGKNRNRARVLLHTLHGRFDLVSISEQ